MTLLLYSVFLASLLGSLHCAGMCGGFVAFYAGTAPAGAQRLAGHLAYSGGRFLVYALFGLLAGFLGGALDLAGSVAGLQRGAAVGAGVLILLWGVVALLRLRGFKILTATRLPTPVQRFTARALGALGDAPPVLRALIIGLLTTFLPCGWLYAFVIAAAGTGSPLGGLAVMIAFWAGTVPILLALGLGVQLLAPRLARRLPVITALALVAVGLALVFGRIERIGLANRQATESRPGTIAESIDFVKSLDAEKAPCCAGPHDVPATPRAIPSRQHVPSPAPDAGGSGPTRDPEKPPCCNGQARDSS